MQAARGGTKTCREGWKGAPQDVGKDRGKERRGRRKEQRLLLRLRTWRSRRRSREPLEQAFDAGHSFPKVADVPTHLAHFLAHGPLAGNDDGRQGYGCADDGYHDGYDGYEFEGHDPTP